MKLALQNAFADQDWNALSKTAHALIELNPSNSRAYYFLGKALYKTQKYEQAIEPLRTAIDDGIYKDYAYFYLASCFASRKENELAYQYLEEAVNLGFIGGDELVKDDNLTIFSSKEAYKKLARYSHEH